MAFPEALGLTVLHPSESLGRLIATHRWQRGTLGFSSSLALHWAQEVVFLTICICYSDGILGPSDSVSIIQSQILNLEGLLPTITFVTKVTIVRTQRRK